MVLFLKHSSSHIIWLRYLPWLFDSSWVKYEGPRVPDEHVKPHSVFLQPTFAIPWPPLGVAHVSGAELFTFPWAPCLPNFMFFPFPELPFQPPDICHLLLPWTFLNKSPSGCNFFLLRITTCFVGASLRTYLLPHSQSLSSLGKWCVRMWSGALTSAWPETESSSWNF